MLIDALTKAGIRPRIALETSSKEILKQFAINELGVAFMPEMVAEEECKGGRLRRLTWEGTPFNIYSQVFVHKDKHINKVIKDLLHFAGFGDMMD